MEKDKTKNIVIIILAIIIGILLVVCTALYVKNEYLEEDNEKIQLNNNSSNENTNNNTDINNTDKTNEDKYISKDEALTIALDNLKISKNDIYDLSNELEYKYGAYVYEVEFKYNRYEYDFYINATDGKIVKSFKEWD